MLETKTSEMYFNLLIGHICRQLQQTSEASFYKHHGMARLQYWDPIRHQISAESALNQCRFPRRQISADSVPNGIRIL